MRAPAERCIPGRSAPARRSRRPPRSRKRPNAAEAAIARAAATTRARDGCPADGLRPGASESRCARRRGTGWDRPVPQRDSGRHPPGHQHGGGASGLQLSSCSANWRRSSRRRCARDSVATRADRAAPGSPRNLSPNRTASSPRLNSPCTCALLKCDRLSSARCLFCARRAWPARRSAPWAPRWPARSPAWSSAPPTIAP